MNRSRYKRELYYYIQNTGDGGVSLRLFDIKELAEICEGCEDEPFSDPGVECITLESASPINVVNNLITLKEVIEEVEDDIQTFREYEGEYDHVLEELEEKLERLEELL